MNKIIVGIDGGGTATTVDFCDLHGSSFKRVKLGPFNLNSIGQERFRKLLNEIFTVIKAEGDCAALCIGAAGISNPQMDGIIREEAAAFELDGKLLLRGDHEIALYGAAYGKPGAILISGTGSVCIGMSKTGETIRAGGWGHLVDDEGSGYALGRDAVSAVVQAFDKRGENTLLTGLVFNSLAVSDIGGLISYVYGSPDKSRIAALSPLVEQAGKMGDSAALQILDRAGRALTRLVEAVFPQMETDTLNLYLLGGLLVNDTLLREVTVKVLSERLPLVRIMRPEADPAGGAVLMAMHSLKHAEIE